MIKLYQGDCLEVMAELPAASVDLILCDLPCLRTKRNFIGIEKDPAYFEIAAKRIQDEAEFEHVEIKRPS